MTRRAIQHFKGTLVIVPELQRPKLVDAVSNAPERALKLKERLVQQNLLFYHRKRTRAQKASIVRRAYSFAGYQRSTKVSTFFKNDVDYKYASSYKRHAGRTSTGTITVYTKGHNTRRRITNYSKNLNATIGFISAVKIFRDANDFKLSVVYATSSGTLLVLPFSSRTHYQNLVMATGAYIFIKRVIGQAVIQRLSLCQQLRLLRFHRAISYVATDVNKRVTIAKASGSRAAILQKNKKTIDDTTLIKQPSGKIRFISSYVIALLGYIRPKAKKTFRNSRAGYWRNIGFKSTVRGIVKNAVDHPHGGRTKTILWPRTPWGKSTK